MNAMLHALLDAQLQMAPEYLSATEANTAAEPPGGGAYSTHLPMALHALAELGASEEQLRDFLAAQNPQPRRNPWPAIEAAEQELRHRLAHQGAAAVMAELLPGRLAHAGAVAFHGLIRSAHAWESQHTGELALALAWWLQRDQALPAPEPGPMLDLDDWWATLLRLPEPESMPQDWISQRMLAWSATPGFARLAPNLALRPDTLQQLANKALQAYASSGNFTVLHLVTASRALQVLGPLLPAEATTQALRDFTQHAAAGLLASRWNGELQTLAPAKDWPELLAAACAATDDHRIKLVHAARHWQQTGVDDALCRAAATRALHKA